MTVDFTNLKSRPGDGSHLTKSQVKYIQEYMKEVLVRLELNYWHVFVAKDLAPEGCLLMIEPTDGRRVAMLYVSETWWNESPDHRLDIVHEALHLAHHDQEEVIRRFKNDTGDVSPYALSIIWSQFKMETERMVDGLSYVLAPTMPEWSPPSEKETLPLVPDGALTVRSDPPPDIERNRANAVSEFTNMTDRASRRLKAIIASYHADQERKAKDASDLSSVRSQRD